jgi:hypothetical protein
MRFNNDWGSEIHSFPNGYGASVIRHDGSYGGPKGLFEIAILDSEGEIDYTTSIASDVIGWLTHRGVADTLDAIAALQCTSGWCGKCGSCGKLTREFADR